MGNEENCLIDSARRKENEKDSTKRKRDRSTEMMTKKHEMDDKIASDLSKNGHMSTHYIASLE